MQKNTFKQVYVKCCFYKFADGERTITCEGLLGEKDSSLTLSFTKRNDYNIHFETFCCQHCEKCEVHRMLMEKYEE